MREFIFANPQPNGLPPCQDCMDLYEEAMFCEKHQSEFDTSNHLSKPKVFKKETK